MNKRTSKVQLTDMTTESDKWKAAPSPNYETNKDKLYPYSEMPFQKEYKLVKIPICVRNLIEHVDYFGYGRKIIDNKTLGFPDCYNVNFEYELVRDGQDKGRKIPNRIPITNEIGRFQFSTSNYLKDNSVLTVTVDFSYGYNTDKELAQDIARIVNSERGKVIIYGGDATMISLVAEELMMKQLFYCPIYMLPDNLQLTYWEKRYRAYLGINELKRELYKNVYKGDIETAVILTGCLNNIYCDDALSDVVNKLLKKNVRNVITYAYKLWNHDKDVVRKHFPSLFQHIFDGDCMVIINKENEQALALDPNTAKARGDSLYKPCNEIGWKIIPILEENESKVLFKLFNIATEKYLQQACTAKDSEELRDKFYFEPLITIIGQVAFKFFYFDDGTPLELPGVGDGSDQKRPSTWILTTANQVKEKSVKKDEQTLSDDEDVSNIYNYD